MELIDILKAVTIDCKDDGRQFVCLDRINVISEILKGSKYKLIYEGKLCRMYSKCNFNDLKHTSAVLISSHVDCVYSKLYCDDSDSRYVSGTFDNSLTNACVLWSMINDTLGDNLIVAFTGDEEVKSGGAVEVANILKSNDINISTAIVQDVTEEGWNENCPFTIENDLGIDMLKGHEIIEMLNSKYQDRYLLIHDAEPDESWDYDEYDIPCFSLCIPILGDMHSDTGVKARKELLPEYCNALGLLTKLLSNDMYM